MVSGALIGLSCVDLTSIAETDVYAIFVSEDEFARLIRMENSK